MLQENDNKIQSLMEIATAIETEVKDDIVSDRSSLRMQDDAETLEIIDPGGSTYAALPVNDYARSQLNRSVAPGFDRYARHLLEEGMNEEYAGQVNVNLARDEKRALLRTRANGTPQHVRAVVSDAYKTIDDDVIYGAALPLVMERADEFRSLGGQRSMTQTQLRIISRNPLGKIGDREIYGGFAIRNSEVGAGFARFETFLFDSFCENGCIFGKKSIADVKWAHRGARISTSFGSVLEARWKQAELESIRGVVADATSMALQPDNYSGLLLDTQEAWEDKVDNVTLQEGVGGVIERVGKHLKLTQAEVEQAKIEFRSGEENRYGVQAAITQAAQKVDSFDRRVDMERAGGDLLGWDSKQWEKVALLS